MDARMVDGSGAPNNSNTSNTGNNTSTGSLANQMPLPNPPEAGSSAPVSSITTANSSGDSASDHSSSQIQRNNSQRSRSQAGTSISDDAADAADAAAVSDADSNVDESTSGKSGRKKKSQRFYCTEFPPCNLSFTRSEHLARHIRKHTGERPFECHCLRRFSRLDNLRQHAQTVHMHEDIPMGSLAASGTRFQRQIRPERTRMTTPGVRARAGSISGPARGHSKSFSTSNIALGPSSFMAREEYREPHDMRDMRDMRPRPPPIATHDPRDPRARVHVDLNAGASAYHNNADGYRPITPPEMTTPTSTTFSNGPASPQWSSNRMVSPSPYSSRPHSMYASTETPTRRLSESLHFQSPTGPSPARHMYSTSVSSTGGPVFSSPDRAHHNGRPVSPDHSTVSAWSRRESFSSNTDERRRTWHPSSRDFGGPASARNGIPGAGPGPTTSVSAGNVAGHHQPGGVEQPPQLAVPNAASASQQSASGFRLPGIDSFLNLPTPRPASPIRRGPSPMMVDGEQRYAPSGPPTSILRSPADQHAHAGRPSSGHWESGLQHGLTRLDIASRTPPQDSARDWAHQQQQQQHQQQRGYPSEDPVRRGPPYQQSVRFEAEVPRDDPFAPSGNRDLGYTPRGHQHTMSAPAFNGPTSRQQKRQALYLGPGGAAANGGVNGRVERMVHPNLANGFTGFPARGVPQTVQEHPPHAQDEEAAYRLEQERHLPPPHLTQTSGRQPLPSQPQQSVPLGAPASDSYRRLDALVAVATNEAQTSTRAF
ncbi:c2h2 transcription factor [Sporothrix schenckii 1099-18]|uniref:C2H2-type domain-containing protein n=2 Tax=Sporothrix schenckii TaxID=29908 RepID=U7PK50_SPOS1|nr:c2h2 transcription factor [Sporothrix schenckii 1099-18]ERS95316.1 hypothetical protein HMPREF1624_08194 [Sporothrix schenckii ATCC 58251]KJR87575.1 c2h2 transcription factor [Sporothrix schenckii 1099-18]